MNNITRTGTLPSGVSFTYNGNGTATLAGTPTVGAEGAYPLQFTAANSAGASRVQAFTLTVACSTPLTLLPASGILPAATYATAYGQNFTATGGSGHTFAVSAGALPAGTRRGAGADDGLRNG